MELWICSSISHGMVTMRLQQPILGQGMYFIRIDFINLNLFLRFEYAYTYLCSIQTPGQVGQVSQVGPWNLGSVHLHMPHSHVPRPLQICLLLAIHVLLSREQSQALPVHMGSQTHTLHSQRPCPEERKCITRWRMTDLISPSVV